MTKTEFDKYFNMNPRQTIPTNMKEFLEFAKKKYENQDCVNMVYADDYEEHLENIKNYIGESMEAILLFKEFLELKDKNDYC
jgi:predicted phosphatase